MYNNSICLLKWSQYVKISVFIIKYGNITLWSWYIFITEVHCIAHIVVKRSANHDSCTYSLNLTMFIRKLCTRCFYNSSKVAHGSHPPPPNASYNTVTLTVVKRKITYSYKCNQDTSAQWFISRYHVNFCIQSSPSGQFQNYNIGRITVVILRMNLVILR